MLTPDPLVQVVQPAVVTVRVPMQQPPGRAAARERNVNRLFGTDGMRAPLRRAAARPRHGDAARRASGPPPRTSGAAAPCVVLGGDTRDSTPEICAWLAAGLRAAGAEVRCAGVIPTPAVAWLAGALGAAAGVSSRPATTRTRTTASSCSTRRASSGARRTRPRSSDVSLRTPGSQPRPTVGLRQASGSWETSTSRSLPRAPSRTRSPD